MERLALDVLGERVLLGNPVDTYDAGHRLGSVHALLLHQEFERPEPPPAGRHLEHTGLLACSVQNRSHIEALQERATANVFRKLLDRNACLHTADVALAERVVTKLKGPHTK